MKESMPDVLRVYHVPQDARHLFYVDVESVDEALKVLKILARYETFQFEIRQKKDYFCQQGLLRFDYIKEDWVEWRNEDGMNINEYEVYLKL